MSEWQDISTAPKDGTPIFIWGEDSRHAYIAVWNPEGTSWTDEMGDCFAEEICKLSVTGTWSAGGGWFQPNEVTHWMPLPSPPKE